MPDVELKPQVYKDPRPKEYFDQFHERARAGGPVDLRRSAHDGHPVHARAVQGARAGHRERPERPVISREPPARSWTTSSPGIHPTARQVYGQVAAVHGTDPRFTSSATAACSPCAAAITRGRVPDRVQGCSAKATRCHVLRGRPLAHGQISTRRSRDRAFGSPDWSAGGPTRSSNRRRCATGSASSSRRC